MPSRHHQELLINCRDEVRQVTAQGNQPFLPKHHDELFLTLSRRGRAAWFVCKLQLGRYHADEFFRFNGNTR